MNGTKTFLMRMTLCKLPDPQGSTACLLKPGSVSNFDIYVNRSVLHTGDPFSIPSHLREHVADFEEQYNATNHRSLYKKILDNNPDPAKENLYE